MNVSNRSQRTKCKAATEVIMADMVVATEVATAAVMVVDMVAKEATEVVEDTVVQCTVKDTKADQVWILVFYLKLL